MPPKKTARANGFAIFAGELKNRQGRKFKSMKEACDAAGPLWSQMNKEQKKRYEDMARSDRNSERSARYTSEGVNVEVLCDEERREQEYKEKMKKDTYRIISDAYNEDRLGDELFFLIHINIFCYNEHLNKYYPAEIAVTAFSLNDGVRKESIFHRLINPGKLPMGYSFDAKKHAEESHEIRIPMAIDEEDNNIAEVYTDLLTFLASLNAKQRLPILYCHPTSLKIVTEILNSWSFEMDQQENMFRVYHLGYMFLYLKNITAKEEVWTEFCSTREFEKDVYAYMLECACDFHSKTDRPQYCSQSITVRYSYIICENCCHYLKIELIPGQHVPIRSVLPGMESSKASSSVASYKSASSKLTKPTLRKDTTDDDYDYSDTESMTSFDTELSAAKYINVSDTNKWPLIPSNERSAPSGGNVSSKSNSQEGYLSYAAASGKGRPGLPSNFEKNVGGRSLNDADFPPMGRAELMKRVLGRGRGTVPDVGRGGNNN